MLAPSTPSSEPNGSTSHSAQIRAFLRARGLPDHKHVSSLSKVLGKTRSTIHRKFSCDKWRSFELESIATRWQGLARITTDVPVAKPVFARIQVKGLSSTATFVPGPPSTSLECHDLVAIKQPNGHWLIVLGSSDQAGQRHAIRSLTVTGVNVLRVAVVSSTGQSAAGLADQLNGFDDLIAVGCTYRELEAVPSDCQAYVIEWADKNLAALVQLRRRSPAAQFIAVIPAAQLEEASSRAILAVCDSLRMAIVEGPARGLFLRAQIRHLLLARLDSSPCSSTSAR